MSATDAYRDALELIARHGCENYTRGSCVDNPGRSREAEYAAEAWCYPCVARAALDASEERPDVAQLERQLAEARQVTADLLAAVEDFPFDRAMRQCHLAGRYVRAWFGAGGVHVTEVGPLDAMNAMICRWAEDRYGLVGVTGVSFEPDTHRPYPYVRVEVSVSPGRQQWQQWPSRPSPGRGSLFEFEEAYGTDLIRDVLRFSQEDRGA